jgi:hypothetical protein
MGLSYRAGLKAIHEDGVGRAILSRSQLYHPPRSLRTTIEAMVAPVSLPYWSQVRDAEFYAIMNYLSELLPGFIGDVVEAQWANAFNGIAAAPGLNRYYASSNGGVAGFKGVFLLDENLEQLDVRKFDFDEAFDPRDGKLKGLSDFGWGGISNNANLHIGGLCCTEQEVYVPVGATSSEWNIGFVWKLSSDLGGPQELWALIAPGIDTSGPSFCAIDAQSGLLYTVAGGPATHFHAFDPKNNFAYVDSIELEVPLKGGGSRRSVWTKSSFVCHSL